MSDQASFRLPAACDIRSIRSIRAEMMAALETAADVTLDGSDVERADIAFVQLVVSAAGTAERQAKRVALTNPTDAVRSAFERAGLRPQAPFAPSSR